MVETETPKKDLTRIKKERMQFKKTIPFVSNKPLKKNFSRIRFEREKHRISHYLFPELRQEGTCQYY